jgi:hypothetical protein
MEITIRPKTFKGFDSWESNQYGVILVQRQEDIDQLWKLLCEQDDYWKSYKNLIKVSPKEIDSKSDLDSLCEYCGKTDIYNVEILKSQIPFIIYQQTPELY